MVKYTTIPRICPWIPKRFQIPCLQTLNNATVTPLLVMKRNVTVAGIRLIRRKQKVSFRILTIVSKLPPSSGKEIPWKPADWE